MDLSNIPETAPTEPQPSTEGPVTDIAISEPVADDTRNFMETFIEDAGSQMNTGEPKSPVQKDAAVEKKPGEGEAAPDKEEKPSGQEDKAKPADVLEKTPPKGMSKEASRVFHELKDELRQARKQTSVFDAEKASLTARITELESTTGDAAKLREDLTAREEKLSEQAAAIQLIRLESSELWKSEVAAPMQSVVAATIALAKEYADVPEGELLSAITTNNKRKLDELLSDIPEYDRFEAHTLRKKYSDIVAHRDELQKSGSERLTRLRSEEQQREHAEIEQDRRERTRQIETTIPAVEKNISRFLETDADKQRMSKAMEIAKSDSLNSYPAHVQAGAVMAVAALPILIRRLDAQSAQITQLNTDIAGYRKSDPGAGGGGQQSVDENSSSFDSGDTFESALVKSIAAGNASR